MNEGDLQKLRKLWADLQRRLLPDKEKKSEAVRYMRGLEKEAKMSRVNICGIPHKVIECTDNFDMDMHFGMIDYKNSEIRINKDLTAEVRNETLCHEILHAIFLHIGRDDLSNDVQLVQCLANAINQTFKVTEYD